MNWPRTAGTSSAAHLSDDVSPRAGNYGPDLRLFGLGHSKLVKGLRKIIEKGFSLWCDSFIERPVYFCGPPATPAGHFRDEVLEACRGNAMMGLVHAGICIEAGIDHDSVDEVIHYGG